MYPVLKTLLTPETVSQTFLHCLWEGTSQITWNSNLIYLIAIFCLIVTVLFEFSEISEMYKSNYACRCTSFRFLLPLEENSNTITLQSVAPFTGRTENLRLVISCHVDTNSVG